MDDAGERRGRRVLVVDLARYAIDRVDEDRHRQLVQIAVVEHAAARRHLKGALLLARRKLHIFTVGGHLQPDQPQQISSAQPAKISATKKSAAAAVPQRLRDWSAGLVRTRTPSTELAPFFAFSVRRWIGEWQVQLCLTKSRDDLTVPANTDRKCSLCQTCNSYCCMRTCAITGVPGPRSVSRPLSGRTTCPGRGASIPSRRATRSSRFRSQSCASFSPS